MMIARDSLQRIVDEVYEAAQHEIYITDELGTVIASSDKKHLGTFHEGAYAVAHSSMTELIVGEDAAYRNEKRGICFPICIEEKIVGVVAIAGEPGEVNTYGRMIQKLTQILLETAWQKDQSNIKENLSKGFLYSWLFDTMVNRDPHFQLRAKTVGIDTSLTRYIAVLSFNYPDMDENKKQIRYESVEIRIKKLLKARSENHEALLISSKLVLFLACPELAQCKEIVEKCIQVLQMAEAGISISAGIGAAAQWYSDVQRSFREAMLAVRIASRTESAQMCVYEDLYLEKLLTSIPMYVKQSFINKLYAKCTVQDKKQIRETLHAFFRNNGSITKAAESQYIHKNTMQYRLSRLKNLTGLDPRFLNDAGVLYTAILIDEELASLDEEN